MDRELAVTIPIDVLERLTVMAQAGELYAPRSPWTDEDREAIRTAEREIEAVKRAGAKLVYVPRRSETQGDYGPPWGVRRMAGNEEG